MDKLSLIVAAAGLIVATIAWPVALGISFDDAVKKFFDSDIALATIGTLVAAFAGAYGAQYIVEKNKVQESLVEEIRATNVAITIATSICRNCLGLKHNTIRPLIEQFQNDKKTFLQIAEKGERTEVPVNFRFNFGILQPPVLPTDFLRDHIFAKISPGSRTIALAQAVHQSSLSFTDSMISRNEMIVAIKARNLNKDELFKFYFGYSEQGRDSIFADIVEAIPAQLDDCIFSIHLLISDLIEHGKALKISCEDKSLEIDEPDFSSAKKMGLFPDEEFYRSWINFKL